MFASYVKALKICRKKREGGREQKYLGPHSGAGWITRTRKRDAPGRKEKSSLSAMLTSHEPGLQKGKEGSVRPCTLERGGNHREGGGDADHKEGCWKKEVNHRKTDLKNTAH